MIQCEYPMPASTKIKQQWYSHVRCACSCRFTDFLVNEIDANGNVVRLTDLDASTSPVPHPQPAKPSEAEKKESEPLQHESAAAPESTPAAAESSSAPAPQQGWAAAAEGFAGILPADSHAAVSAFYEAIAAFEAARTHGLPKQEDGSERDYVRYSKSHFVMPGHPSCPKTIQEHKSTIGAGALN